MESTNIVFIGQNQLVVQKESVPDLKPHEVLVQTACTLISTGTELICFERKFDAGTPWDRWVQYPFYPGYCQAGRIVRVGEAVTTFKEGDRVATRCPHRQFTAVAADDVFPIPQGVSDEDASWATLAYIVQHGFRKAQVALGDVVVVIGLGLLGQLIVQYARLAGAGEIIAIDTAPRRLAMAEAHGATHALEVSVHDALPIVTEVTGGALANIVFDMTGHSGVFAAALTLLRRFGKLVLIGDTGTPAEQHLTSDVLRRDLTIIGAHATNPPPQPSDYAYWTQANMVQLFYKFIERGQIRVSDLVTHRYSPTQAAEAYHMLQTNRAEAMGVIFDFARL
jgi:2-desacetyl-2-hydroxyethyl bacteriochlorophyllide A dehydrogenase